MAWPETSDVIAFMRPQPKQQRNQEPRESTSFVSLMDRVELIQAKLGGFLPGAAWSDLAERLDEITGGGGGSSNTIKDGEVDFPATLESFFLGATAVPSTSADVVPAIRPGAGPGGNAGAVLLLGPSMVDLSATTVMSSTTQPTSADYTVLAAQGATTIPGSAGRRLDVTVNVAFYAKSTDATANAGFGLDCLVEISEDGGAFVPLAASAGDVRMWAFPSNATNTTIAAVVVTGRLLRTAGASAKTINARVSYAADGSAGAPAAGKVTYAHHRTLIQGVMW